MRAITPSPAEWDAFVLAHPHAHFLQLSAWGEHKGAFGWTYARVALEEGGRIVAGAQLLFKPLPLRLGTMAYLPYGSYVTHASQWGALWQAVHRLARRHRAVFLKWEAGFQNVAPSAWGFRPSAHTVQPPRTVLLDIRADEEALLAGMNQGTRRKVRQSLKNDVRYYEASPADLPKFTALMRETGERNAFGVYSADYYANAYRLFVPQHATLWLAEHEGDTLAGAFIVRVGKLATYLYGASASHKRNLMASYGVQWQAIRWAQAHGCETYDFWGIPDADDATLEAEFEARHDGLWGVYGFKRGWGGRVARTAGAWDMVYNPLFYALYRWRARR